MPTKAILFTLLVLAAGTADAQRAAGDRPAPAERAAKQTERLATVLDLSPEQQERVGEINLRFAEDIREARADREAERAAARAELQAANDKRKAEMKAVLTEEQYAKLEALQERRRDRREDGHRRGRRGGDRN
ncbi:DUF4890 domain-containing protein [Lewinella sp. IMCC34183]|uniref:DUF4890 domain-containing protein n=1 Tax=Lewinella sp. IMCC34183 TaxID=2248762 RepID=UPI000E255CBF|nr:hypothetical protein [Lewinella sp. IMCC34183]